MSYGGKIKVELGEKSIFLGIPKSQLREGGEMRMFPKRNINKMGIKMRFFPQKTMGKRLGWLLTATP